ncbi:hypothetical protein [Lewinella sp. IMCC34183]|uniref:hypothetical protein n=1 Tax=Lewinella sp. IMCC34183 TaxID=2248762 RepID=UPI000E280B3E|nr:hypothetical protein [Lewinella sp. IMCC34183]
MTADGNFITALPGSPVSTVALVGGVLVPLTTTGPRYCLLTSAAVLHVAREGTGTGLDAVDVSGCEGHAELTWSSMFRGASAGVSLAGDEVSIFDINLVVGVRTGAGSKDDSVEFRVAGVGGSIGRKISIFGFDASLGSDPVRTEKGVVPPAKEIGIGVAPVPGGLSDGAAGCRSQSKLIPAAFAPVPKPFAEAGEQLGEMAVGAVSDSKLAPGNWL